MKKGITLLSGALLTFALTSCGSTISSSLLSSGNGSSGGEVSSSVSGGPSTASDGTGSGDTSASQDTSSNTSQGGSASSQGTSTTSVSIGGSLTDTASLYFHYHRSDGNYDGWGLWTWAGSDKGTRRNFDQTDGFGAYEVIPLSTWGTSSLSYIVSTAAWAKDPGADESLNFADYTVDSIGNVIVFKMTGTTGLYKTASEALAAGASTSSASSGGGSTSTTSYQPGSSITSISYPSTSVSHPADWYNKWNIDETAETRNTLPTTSTNAKTYNDFKLWNEYPSSYWKTVSPYTGTRKDFRDEQIYFCITTRFYNGDLTNDARCWDQNASTDYYDPPWRGDFKGLIEKMDYIKALGFTSIWITPVVENTSGLDYHGYHASNLNKVDPRYESTDVDFQKVITEAHKRDMKIVLDVVWNHTGNFGEMGLCPMFSKKGDLSYFNCEQVRADSGLPSTYNSLAAGKQYDARLAMMKNTDGVNHDVNYYYHHYGNFSWETWGEQMAQIAGDCVDLNTENPVVAEYLLRCYGQFIRMGVDAFRVDTMKQISRLTLNKFYIGAFQKFAEKCGNPNFFMYGEVCARAEEAWNHGVPAVSAPFYTWAESKDYDWGTSIDGNIAATETAFKDAADTNAQPTSTNAFLSSGYVYHAPDHSKASGTSVIDFPMHWAFCNATHAYQNCANVDKYFNDCTYNVVYVNSHDYSPNGRCDMMPEYDVPTWCEDFDLMYTFRGIPCMYYGTEVQFQAGKVIDQGGNSALSNTGRAYFGEHLEGSVTTTGFGSYSAASGNLKDTLASTISQHLMKLSKIRQAVPALRYGQYTACTNNNMAFVKRYTSGSIDSVAAVAISSSYNFTGLPDGTYVDVVSGATKVVSGGTLSVSGLSQAKMAVYVLQNASSGTLSKIGGSTTYLA